MSFAAVATSDSSDAPHARFCADRIRPTWPGWSSTTLPVVVATVLLLLGLVNIVQRATQEDVEDGVLWGTALHRRRRGGGRSPLTGGPCRRPSGRRPAGHRRPDHRSPRRRARPPAGGPPRRAARLHAARARRPSRRPGDAAADSTRCRRPVLRAGGRRHLLASGWRHRAHQTAHRSGDAALLLAVGRVLRRLHVLVLWPPRPRRLGVLLGRPDCHPVPAAAVRALRAGVP